MSLFKRVMLPVGCMVATATIVFVSECVSTSISDKEIYQAADGLELKLNEYQIATGNAIDARRLLGYYYCGLMAKYRPLVQYRKALKYLETKYASLMKRT